MRTTRLRVLAAVLLALGVAGVGSASPARAATTLTVTYCGDDSQLQADVATANSDNAGDTIAFSCSGDIYLSNTFLIDGSMSLDGSGQNVTLDGGFQQGIQIQPFVVLNSGVTLTLNHLTVAFCFGSFFPAGGAIANLGGTVSVTNSTLSGNVSGDGSGGAIYTESGTVNITNSLLWGNAAIAGGAIYNDGGTLTVANSTLLSNDSTTGGAIDNVYGKVAITNSTLSANSTNPFLTFPCCYGGAIANQGGTLTVANSTLASNSAQYGGAIYNRGTMSIGGSIIADNPSGGDCDGSITSSGYNLEGGTSCGFTGTGDLQNTDPRLDPPVQNNGVPTQYTQNNGGPTQTSALLSGSPAIDHIPTSSGLCPATDQRGFTRPDNSETSCDIGAYESAYTIAPTTTSLKSSANPSVVGQQVTYMAMVSPAPDGGTVTFQDGGTAITGCASQTLSTTGQATCAMTYSGTGSHAITASYSGDTNFLTSSTTSPLTQYVDTNLSSYPKLSNGAYNLSSANLSGGYFVSANLSGANIKSATLTGATLTSANFTGANFTKANLTNANLTMTNLKTATGMSTATLTGVIWNKTTCPDNTSSTQDGGTCLGHL